MSSGSICPLIHRLIFHGEVLFHSFQGSPTVVCKRSPLHPWRKLLRTGCRARVLPFFFCYIASNAEGYLERRLQPLLPVPQDRWVHALAAMPGHSCAMSPAAPTTHTDVQRHQNATQQHTRMHDAQGHHNHAHHNNTHRCRHTTMHNDNNEHIFSHSPYFSMSVFHDCLVWL